LPRHMTHRRPKVAVCYPIERAATVGLSTVARTGSFADSPLEERGFEPPVPLERARSPDRVAAVPDEAGAP
jgi:hypothetical protein